MKAIVSWMVAGALGALAAGAAPGDGFSLRLYQAVAGKGEGNVAVSPYSVAQALALAAAGAKGETADQILAAVVPSDVADVPGYFALKNGDWAMQAAAGGGRLGVANGIWTAQGQAPAPEFAAIAEEAYGAKAATLDLVDPEAAAEELNGWVEEKTDGMVRRLLSARDLSGAPPVVLINAIAFQGRWKHPFAAAETEAKEFTAGDGTKGLVPMMRMTRSFAVAELEEALVLRLPYAGDELEMRVLLPRRGVELSALEARLAEEWGEWAALTSFRPVEVWLPKFAVAWGPADLRGELKALGIEDAFDERADFSGMGAGLAPGMPIGFVLHTAKVEVSEEGTKAAAATAVGIVKSAMRRPPPPLEFHADRPFLFTINEAASGSILFIGRVERPDGFEGAAAAPEAVAPEEAPAPPAPADLAAPQEETDLEGATQEESEDER